MASSRVELVIGIDHTREQSRHGLGTVYAKDFANYGSAGLCSNTFSINDFNFESRQKSYFINGTYPTPNYLGHVRSSIQEKLGLKEDN